MELVQFHMVLEKEKKSFFLHNSSTPALFVKAWFWKWLNYKKMVPVTKMLTKFQVGLCIFSFVAS
jgi:hypothetical protein